MKNATHYRKAATGLISFVAIGLLSGRNLSFYRLEEILICWLVFILVFISLTFVILVGALVSYAGEWIIHRVTTAPRAISTVALLPSEIYSGIISAQDPSEPAKEFPNPDA